MSRHFRKTNEYNPSHAVDANDSEHQERMQRINLNYIKSVEVFKQMCSDSRATFESLSGQIIRSIEEQGEVGFRVFHSTYFFYPRVL